MPEEKDKNSAFVADNDIYNKNPKIEPTPEKQIGIDTNDSFFRTIIDAGISDKLDMSALDSFLTTSRSRDQLYSLIDDMSNDSTIAAVLETYAEDATDSNENGDIVWADSSDASVSKYVNYLLKSMRVNKNVYKWVYSLCKYGDLYLRLYRESDYDSDDLFEENEKNFSDKRINEEIHLSDPDLDSPSKEKLDESVKIKAYSKDDHYVHYLEMIPNPAEMFELTKFGKAYAYIKSEVNTPISGSRDWYQGSEFMKYRFNRNDIRVYSPTEFVHGCLEDNIDRIPEEVNISFDDGDDDKDTHTTRYKVKRGQSLLYNVFRIWRELQLLENSVLLNRVTKSAIVRILSVEVGDMPKENVSPFLQGIKSLIEQKSALEANMHMNEYTNPGPIENNVYIPTHEGVGAISMQTVGGDVNIGELTDLDYFRRKLFGALRVPSQFFSFTDDNAGFSGGQSLSIISSRYAKMVIRIQNVIVQTITDAINLMLLDKNLPGYINKFSIKMKKPITQDDIDRKDQMTGNLQVTNDIMNLVSDMIEDRQSKLEIAKSLLSAYLPNPEVLDILQQEIDKIEKEEEESEQEEQENQEDVGVVGEEPSDNLGSYSLASELGLTGGGEEGTQETTETEQTNSEEEGIPDESSQGEEEALPTPSSLGVDFTNSDLGEFQ